MRAPKKNAKYPHLHGQWGKTAKQMGDKPSGVGQKLDYKLKNHKEPWEVVYQRKKWEAKHPHQVKGLASKRGIMWALL